MEVDRGTARFGSPHGSEAKYARAIRPEYRPLPPTVQLIFSLKQLRIEDLGANKLRNNADELWRASIHPKNHQERGQKPASLASRFASSGRFTLRLTSRIPHRGLFDRPTSGPFNASQFMSSRKRSAVTPVISLELRHCDRWQCRANLRPHHFRRTFACRLSVSLNPAL